MRPIKVDQPKILVKTKWFTISLLSVTMPNGDRVDWEYIDEEVETVCGSLIDNKGQVVMVKEWRGAWRGEVLGVVTGGIPRGISIKQAAVEFVREAREETGYRPRQVTFLGLFKHAMSSNGRRFIFTGQDLVNDPLPPDKGEMIEVVRFNLDDLIERHVYKGRGVLTTYSALTLLLTQRYLKETGSDS